MEPAVFQNPALTIGLALFAGMIAQAIAKQIRMPGIVVLLATGVILGPDGLGVVQPSTLGGSLHTLVGFAVAVILFDGALNLNMSLLRKQARSIRQMSTIGAIVTALAATLAAHFILRWDAELSILFGTLVTVTGPTVVGPLLRRIRAQSHIATVLNAEGIFVDAIGAIIAIVALELIIVRDATLGHGVANAAASLGGGFLFGLIGGLIAIALLRVESLVAEGSAKLLTLALVIALFQVSNAVIAESGITAVVVAGLLVGNVRSVALPELKEFKEHLTTMLLGLLFVLLAADVRLSEVRALGSAGVWLVIVLMVIVRPLNVAVGTLGTELTLREKAFMAWLAPRGIVAAAVSSLFATTLDAEGIGGGDQLRAMVFLLIAVTVTVGGLTGPFVARILKVRRASQSGYAILGANALGRGIAECLSGGGDDVVLIDSNPMQSRLAEDQKLRVIHGSGLSESVQLRAELDIRAGCIGVTANDEVNLLFARQARKHYRTPKVWISVRRGQSSLTPETVHRLESRVLFGRPRSIDMWLAMLDKSDARPEAWSRSGIEASLSLFDDNSDEQLFLPLVVQRGKKRFVVDESTAIKRDDIVFFFISPRRREEAIARLGEMGWTSFADTADVAG